MTAFSFNVSRVPNTHAGQTSDQMAFFWPLTELLFNS